MRTSWGTRPQPVTPSGQCGKPIKKGRFVARPVEKPTDVAQGSYEEGYCTKVRGHLGPC